VGFVGSIDYLIPTTSLTGCMADSIDRVLTDAAGLPSSFHVHFDAGEIGEGGLRLRAMFSKGVSVHCWDSGVSRGPASVRNSLAFQSNADFLVFVDSDVTLTHHFDRRLRKAISATGGDWIIYPRILGDESSPVSLFFQEYIFAPRKTPQGRLMITSAVFGISKSNWERTQGFNEAYSGAGGEDWEFFRDVQRPPFELSIAFHEDLVAFHQNPTTLRELRHRADRYAKQAYLHTPLQSGGPRPNIPRLIAKVVYRGLLGLNRGIALLSRREGAMGRMAASSVLLRNGLIATVRFFRGSTGPRDTSWDYLLLMERIRYRRSLGHDPDADISHEFVGKPISSPTGASRRVFGTSLIEILGFGRRPTRSVSPEFFERNRLFYLVLRMVWHWEYQTRWYRYAKQADADQGASG
jgi:hypothetical protein